MKEEIITKNLGLIYKVMKDMHCEFKNEDYFDEYYFAGLIGLIEASKTYDEEKGRSGYLYRAIKMRIYNVFLAHTRKKRYTDKPNISINTPIYSNELIDYIEDSYSFEEDFINKDYVRWLLGNLKDTKYKKYLMEYFGIDNQQLNLHELSKKYKKSYQYMYQSVQRGIAMLRKEIENEENFIKNKAKMGTKSYKQKYEIKTRNQALKKNTSRNKRS